jgi:hypothetical protein
MFYNLDTCCHIFNTFSIPNMKLPIMLVNLSLQSLSSMVKYLQVRPEAYPKGTWLGSGLTRKYIPILERHARGKHSSLFSRTLNGKNVLQP